VAPIARGHDAQVVGRRGQTALEGRFELAILGLAGAEGQVVAEEQEAVGRAAQGGEHVGQVQQIGLVDLDDAQPAIPEAVEQSPHRRGLPGTAFAVEQNVVRRMAADELLRVRDQPLDRPLHADEVGEVEELGVLDRQQATASGAHIPAEGPVALEHPRVGRGPEPLEERALAELEHALRKVEEAAEASHVVWL
jgi:hypothetical protein